MRAIALSFDGARRTVDAREALAAACAGTPILLEGFLADAGLLEPFTDGFLSVVRAITSPERADYLRSAGLQRLHEVMEPEQVVDLLARLDTLMARDSIALARALVNATAPAPAPHYFICARTFVRAQIPLDIVETRPRLMAARHLEGHLRPTGPHRDSQLTHPRGSLSLWSAIGPIQEGNSLELFDDTGRTAIRPTLAPGDLLLFNADCLHASVPNRTNETRVGVGTRIVVGRWLRFGPGTHWRPWYDERLLDTPLAPLASLQSRLTIAALRRYRWRRQWNRERRRAAAASAS